MARSEFAKRRVIAIGASVVALGSLALAAGPAADAPPPSTAPAAPQALAPGEITLPSSRPTTSPSTRPTTRAISMNFKDVPLDVVLDHLCDAAGLVIIKEGPVDGRVTVQSTEPVSSEEAVTLLNAVLKANGFTAVQNGRIVRIAARDKAKKGSVPVHVGADPESIAATDELITQVIPLTNVDAAKLRQDLTPLLSTDADVAANEASNSIIMTDSSANIRRIAEIIKALDQGQLSGTELRLIHLKFADAQETAKLISNIFHPAEGGAGGMTPQQMQQMQQQGMQMPGRTERDGRVPGGAIDQALRGGHVRADSDERTNTLILTAPEMTLKVIEGIVKELDSNPIPASQLRAFHLNFADAETTAKLLTNLYKGDENENPFFRIFGGGGGDQASKGKINITDDARTNSVIVSAPMETLKSIEDLLKDLDASPASGTEVHTFPLKHASAYETANMIKSIFDPDTKHDSGPIGFIFLGGNGPAGKAPKVVVTSDDRTNTLIVSGPKEAMSVVQDLVTKLDSNSVAEDSLFIYHLRNAQAANLETVLNTLFGNTSSQGQNPNQQPNGNNNQQGQQNQGNGPGNSSGNSNGSLAGGTGIGARHGQRNGQGFGQQKAPRMPPNLTAAINEMSGEVFIVADTDTNSLLVTTASKFKDSVRDIIKELDRPAPQVLIKVLIAEVSHDNAADWGLDFSVLNTRASGNGQTLTNNLGNAASGVANGGLVVSVLETKLNLTLHALATQGKLDVLSRPYILASDNQEATITVGQEVPFITNSQTTELGQIINTIQYQDVGIILNVTPHINPEGLVILDVAPEVSQLSGTTVPITTGVAAPIIDKRSAESRVGIKDGETIVIGGLMQDQKTLTISKVPLLGDIPILGELFRRTQIDRSKTELLIFLTPHVALQPETLNGMSGEEMRGTRVIPHAVDPGVFEEHMNGLRRGGSTADTQPFDPATTEPVKSIRGEGAPQPQ